MNTDNIILQGVEVKYGTYTALIDINTTIKKDDGLISIMGPNGCGKTTLLSCIAGLKKITKGSITIQGKDIKNYKPKELSKIISFMKQSNQFTIRISVLDLLKFGRYPYSKDNLTKEDLEIIDHYMDYLHIRQYKDRYINELSGGQRQRVLIAMMLIQQTPWMLLDEPLNNLDIYYAKMIMKILRDIVDKENKTILLVNHDLNFAANYSDNIMIINHMRRISYKDKTENIMKKNILEEIYETDIDILTNNKSSLLCDYYT